MAVFAVVGALALFMTLTPNDASAQQQEVVPGAPTDLMLRALDQSTIELKWMAPSDDAGGVPDGYRIDYSADGLVWYSLVANQSGTKYVDNKDLEASETRHYRVFAFNTAGTSEMLGPSMIATTASTKPDAPTALVVSPGVDSTPTDLTDAGSHVDNEHLIVKWTPPVDPPGAPVTAYRIQVSKNGSSFSDLENELKVKDVSCSGTPLRCQYTHEGLFESTERWYRIYAMNAVGESPGSETRSGTTDAGEIPALPINLRVGVTTAGEMRLYWDRPSTEPIAGATHNPPGAPITGYYIVGGPVEPSYAPSSGATVTNLIFQKPNSDSSALEAGINIAVNAEAPSLDYVVFHSQGTERALNTGSELATLAKLAGKASPAHATEALRTHWGFQVMAVNRVVERKVQNGRKIEVAADTTGGVDGNWSHPIRVNDSANQDGMFARPTISADRHAGSNNGRTGIELDWSVVGTPTAYRVEYSEDRIDWKPLTGAAATMFGQPDNLGTAVGTADTTGVHQNLVASTSYDYRVFAQQPNTVGAPEASILTQASAAVRETTATPDRPNMPELGDPSPVSETELGMTVIVLEAADPDSETPPVIGAESGDTDVGFGKLVGYRIEISDDGRDWTKYAPVEIGPKRDVRYSYSEKTMELTETKVTPTADSHVQFRYTGLHQKATRHFRASTINNAPGTLKYSVASGVKMGTTNESLTSDDPGGLVAKAKDRNNIELVWYARGDHITAAPVTGYKIESSPLNDEGDCAETWTTLEEDTESTDTSYTHMDLMPGAGFCYRVFGINVVDVSTSFIGFGDAYVSTYDNDAIATTDPAVAPMMPTGVTATAGSDNPDTHIVVSWMAPADDGGSEITGYDIEYTAAGGTAMMMEDCCTDLDGNLAADDGITASTEYSIRVRASNDVGDSEWTAAIMHTTDRTNTAPVVGTAFADQTVTAGDSVSVDIEAANFTDPEDDTLTYTAESDNTDVATAYAHGDHIDITGVAAGTATITVTATDTGNMAGTLSVSQEFTVTVTSAAAIRPTITGTPSVLGNSISVIWDTASNQGAEQIKVALFDLDENGDVLRLAMGYDGNVHTINPAVSNPGAHTFTNVPAGTYKVAVANFANGMHRSIVSGEVTVQ